MPNDPAYILRRVEPIYEIKGIRFDGADLCLEPELAKLFLALTRGPVHFATYPSPSKGHVHNMVSRLRSCLQDAGVPLKIISIFGKGYRLIAEDPAWSAEGQEDNHGRTYASSGCGDSV